MWRVCGGLAGQPPAQEDESHLLRRDARQQPPARPPPRPHAHTHTTAAGHSSATAPQPLMHTQCVAPRCLARACCRTRTSTCSPPTSARSSPAAWTTCRPLPGSRSVPTLLCGRAAWRPPRGWAPTGRPAPAACCGSQSPSQPLYCSLHCLVLLYRGTAVVRHPHHDHHQGRHLCKLQVAAAARLPPHVRLLRERGTLAQLCCYMYCYTAAVVAVPAADAVAQAVLLLPRAKCLWRNWRSSLCAAAAAPVLRAAACRA